jgi:hypothetical protein
MPAATMHDQKKGGGARGGRDREEKSRSIKANQA